MSEELRVGQHKYKQIADLIRRDIQSNLYQEKIPGERFLSQKYSVQPKTLAKAVSLLINEGLLYRLTGIGTFVVDRSTLLKQQPIQIGLILPSLNNPFHSKFTEIFQLAASRKSISVSVNILPEKKVGLSQILIMHKKRGTHALVINDSVFFEVKDASKEIRKASIPIIKFGDKLVTKFGDAVLTNVYSGAMKAVSHLVEKYGGSVAHISGSRGNIEEDGRYLGYGEALRNHGIQLEHGRVKLVEPTYRGGYQAVKEMLNSSNPPKAFFMFNDTMGMGAERAINEKGLKIPNDVGLAGFDDCIHVNEMLMPLTTVRYPYEKWADSILKLVERRLVHPSADPKIMRIEPKLIIRKSSSPEHR